MYRIKTENLSYLIFFICNCIFARILMVLFPGPDLVVSTQYAKFAHIFSLTILYCLLLILSSIGCVLLLTVLEGIYEIAKYALAGLIEKVPEQKQEEQKQEEQKAKVTQLPTQVQVEEDIQIRKNQKIKFISGES